jgi:2-keto-4-pentenoate hydratase
MMLKERDRFDAELAKFSGETVAWKLGATTTGTRKAFNTEQVYYGAVMEQEIWCKGDDPHNIEIPIFRGEAEIAVRVGQDVPNDLRFKITNKIFDAFAPCIESPWSVVSNLPDAGLPALIMDRCAAAGLFIGDVRTIDELEMGRELRIIVDGKTVALGSAPESLIMSPMNAALAAIDVIQKNGLALKKGQWIATGGVTPCVELPHDQAVQLYFGDSLEYEISMSKPQ